MAEIVLGVGTSHSPLLAIPGELWPERGRDDLRRTDLHLSDGRVLTYDELNAEVGGRYSDRIGLESFRAQHEAAQQALDTLRQAIAEVRPHVLIVVGDDQNELFDRAHNPAIAIFTGAEVAMHPKNEVRPDLPQWHRTANRGYSMDTATRHKADPAMATALVEGLITAEVDVAVAAEVADPYKAGFGHAFGFVAERLLTPDAPAAILPVMLNTYFPPNVPTPGRCYDIGRKIAEVVAALPDDRRVGIVASGGLSHFVVDEDLDRAVLDAMARKDADALRAVPPRALRSGNSETLNWIMTAGVVETLDLTHSKYIPARRTEAGTGIGLAFTVWR